MTEPLGGVVIRDTPKEDIWVPCKWVMDECDVSQQIKHAGEEGARGNVQE